MKEKRPIILRARSIDGTVFQLKISTVTEYFFDGVFLRFTLLYCLILVLILTSAIKFSATEIPDAYSVTMILLGVVFNWLIFSTFILAWLTLIGGLLLKLIKLGWTHTLYTPVFYVPALIVIFVSNRYLHYGSDLTHILVNVSLVLVLCVALDVFHSHFIVPLHPKHVQIEDVQSASYIALDVSKGADETATSELIPDIPSEPLLTNLEDTQSQVSAESKEQNLIGKSAFLQPQSVEIGNQTFDIADIRWIESEDHYLKIQIASQNRLVRANLSDVAKLLEQADGSLLNRSFWVAHREIAEVKKAIGGRLELILKNGKTVSIPRARKKVLKERLEEFSSKP